MYTNKDFYNMQKDLINKLTAFSVLYVEDEDGIRNNIEEILKYFFKEVSSAKNVSEAYMKYLQNKPDLILQDLVPSMQLTLLLLNQGLLL